MKRVIVVGTLFALLAGVGFAWFSLYGPCGTKRVHKAASEFSKILDNWDTSLSIAGGTHPVSLPVPVRHLHEIRARATDVEVPACLQGAKEDLDAGMALAIKALIGMMYGESEATVFTLLDQGLRRIEAAGARIEEVEACAPFCP